MKVLHWLVEELKEIFAVTVYFAFCFAVVLLLKQLLLVEYGIEFEGLSKALLAALVTAKILIILDKVPLSRRLERLPGAINVVIYTAIYTIVTVLALMLEKAFDMRSEEGGFGAAVSAVFGRADHPEIWATCICVALSFLAYRLMEVVRQEVGSNDMRRIFLHRKEPLGES